MTDKPSKEQLDKEMEQFLKDLNELDKKIEMIGKIGYVGKNMPPDILNALLVKEPFVLSPPLKEHYDIEEIKEMTNYPLMKKVTSI